MNESFEATISTLHVLHRLHKRIQTNNNCHFHSAEIQTMFQILEQNSESN